MYCKYCSCDCVVVDQLAGDPCVDCDAKLSFYQNQKKSKYVVLDSESRFVTFLFGVDTHDVIEQYSKLKNVPPITTVSIAQVVFW